MAVSTNLAPILMVEDSDEDFEAVRWAMRRLGRELPLLRCADGDSALELLRGEGARAGQGALWPALILLDLNLPGTDGREVLAELKQDARLLPIPVVVMTTSSNPLDVADCFAQGANGYFLKPVDFERFTAQMRLLLDFWLGTALLPRPLVEQPPVDAAIRAGRP